MERTTIMLPADLRLRAARRAAAGGTSLGEFIRQAMLEKLAAPPEPRGDDPFWSDREVFAGAAPGDLAARHDDYLYGDAPAPQRPRRRGPARKGR